MKKKLVFILSSNYSGSHLLSLMLGSHSRAEHLGELKNLVKASGGCHICEDPEVCQLFHGIRQLPKKELYETLFSRVPEGVEMLIDASKKPEWFQSFIDDERYDVRLIHLVRDPRALARRWLIRFDEKGISKRERLKQLRKNPRHFFKILFANILNVVMYKWCRQNREIMEFVESSDKPVKVVTYRSIAIEPDKTLAELCEFLGVEYEPGQKDYWKFPHHGTEKPEYKKGGLNGNKTYFDTRWKAFLSAEQVRLIESHSAVGDLLQRLGLKISAEGLEKI